MTALEPLHMNSNSVRSFALAIAAAFVVLQPICRGEEWKLPPPLQLVLPAGDPPAGRLARSTLGDFLSRFYGQPPVVIRRPAAGDTCLVLGTPETNPLLRQLVHDGLQLTAKDLGDEGFQLLTHQRARVRYVIVFGRTPRALKHGCQELLFYHLRGATDGFSLDGSLAVVRVPEFSYRGIYMLPCWAAHDSLASWERVLRFNSELTLNRNWFWLDGFPVAGHIGEYTNTPLADERAVQRLIDLVNAEAMKFYIGGGWMTWHHKRAVGHDIQKGTDYYLRYLKTFKGVGGFYFEPTGEPWNDGRGDESQTWLAEVEGLQNLTRLLLKKNPDLEIALAIGRWNNPEYLKRMATLDPKRVFWWWCWGNPLKDDAQARFPNVLRWHNQFKQSPTPDETHGAREPPMPAERGLTGMVTSYDPGGGFGSPWGNLSHPNFLATNLIFGGTTRPQDFDPYTLPYFYLQYFFRERCWNLNLTTDEFEARLQRRLFDADAPAEAGRQYARLSRLVLRRYDDKKFKPAPDELSALRAFLDSVRQRAWTPRMRDTLRRMDDALTRLEQL
jgi:hypothetical protein